MRDSLRSGWLMGLIRDIFGRLAPSSAIRLLIVLDDIDVARKRGSGVDDLLGVGRPSANMNMPDALSLC